MKKAPTLTEKSKKQLDNIKKRHQKLRLHKIADRLRMVSWSNSSHPTGVVKPDLFAPTFPLTATARKKEEIWLSPLIKAPTLTDKSKKQLDNNKNATKNFDYTRIADRLRMVSWSNSGHPTGVVKPDLFATTFPLTATAV